MPALEKGMGGGDWELGPGTVSPGGDEGPGIAEEDSVAKAFMVHPCTEPLGISKTSGHRIQERSCSGQAS